MAIGLTAYLEHGQEQVFFATLVLVSVDCEHDSLQQGINLSHGDESAKMGNVTWFGLEEEQQVAVFLRLLVVGKEAFLEFEAVCKVVGDFILLQWSVQRGR